MLWKYLILVVVITFNLFLVVWSKGETMPKKTIAIDLDGVLNNYTKYANDIPEMRKGAKEFIIKLSKEYNLILFTNRSCKLATEWLIKNKLNDYFKDVTNVKPIATLYIDDRAINFKGDYDKTLNKIEGFRVYWKE